MQTQIKRLSRKQIDANEATEGVKQDVTNAARYILQQANTIEARKADRMKAHHHNHHQHHQHHHHHHQ